jgi:uncharacterized protein (TIGR00255 family)
MIVSMTGYGRGEAKDRQLAVAVEVRTVNHRHFEAVINLPQGLWKLEARLRERLRASIRRGHAECSFFLLHSIPGQYLPIVDLDLASRYTASLRAACARLHLPGEPDLALVAGLPNVVRLAEQPVRSERLGALVNLALAAALRRVDTMRRAEGSRLSVDLRKRLAKLQAVLREIENLLRRRNHAAARAALARRALAEPAEAKRPAPETNGPGNRGDVTEEVVRLHSHLTQFRKFLHSPEAVGRRLDFLIQEMNREINTLGSKSADTGISHRVVAIKEELEKIREQVQNLE